MRKILFAIPTRPVSLLWRNIESSPNDDAYVSGHWYGSPFSWFRGGLILSVLVPFCIRDVELILTVVLSFVEPISVVMKNKENRLITEKAHTFLTCP